MKHEISKSFNQHKYLQPQFNPKSNTKLQTIPLKTTKPHYTPIFKITIGTSSSKPTSVTTPKPPHHPQPTSTSAKLQDPLPSPTPETAAEHPLILARPYFATRCFLLPTSPVFIGFRHFFHFQRPPAQLGCAGPDVEVPPFWFNPLTRRHHTETL